MAYERSVQQKEKHQPSPKLTVEEMVEIACKLSKERGRYVSYGDVQQMILTGKLDVRGRDWNEGR